MAITNQLKSAQKPMHEDAMGPGAGVLGRVHHMDILKLNFSFSRYFRFT